jgi:hypothetical protein
MSKDHCIEPDNRATYSEALEALIAAKTPFVIGGAFAVHFYTDIWRDTRDVDCVTTPNNAPRAVQTLLDAGFSDFGEMAEGDNRWIFHGRKRDVTVDIIWRFANQIEDIGEEWLREGVPGEFLGYQVRYAPLEELIYTKVFTLNRHRCDWPDVMRLLQNEVQPVRWDYLLDLLGEHWLLLSGLIDVFDWEYPSKMDLIPEWLRRELRGRHEKYHPASDTPSKEALLDPWVYTRKEDICNSAQ